MSWRDITAAEVASRPEARLGGALLWMVIACTIGSMGTGLLATLYQLSPVG